MAMSLVEAINTAQTEYNQCVNRQTKLLNELERKEKSAYEQDHAGVRVHLKSCRTLER